MRLLWVCLALLCVAASASSQEKAVLTGIVKDSEGAVISQARVVIHWDSAGTVVGLKNGAASDEILATDARGKFTTEIPPGFYDVFISSTAFSPQCAKVRLTAGKNKEYEFKLRVDPLVSRELD